MCIWILYMGIELLQSIIQISIYYNTTGFTGIKTEFSLSFLTILARMSNPWPAGHMQPSPAHTAAAPLPWAIVAADLPHPATQSSPTALVKCQCTKNTIKAETGTWEGRSVVLTHVTTNKFIHFVTLAEHRPVVSIL